MAIVAAALLGGMVIAWVLLSVLGGTSRRARREINRARGAERPDWAPGIWICAACRSSNHPTADRCATCRRPRQDLARDPEAPRPDWIPERIIVPTGMLAALLHDPAAHSDPGEAHWRVVIGGQTVGSAARRDGALGLLRAIEGADTILLDVRGTGAAAYRLVDVIARFEAPRFPLDLPCPERGT